MSSWYFVKDGQRNGPMRREELDAHIAAGAVGGDTLVWRPGLAAWVPASQLAELGVPPPVPPPPLPAPAAESGFAPSEASDGGSEFAAGAPAAAFAPGAEKAVAAAPRLEFAAFRSRLAAKLVDIVLLAGIGRGVEWGVTRWVYSGVMPAPPDWAGFLEALVWLVSINTLVAMVYTVFFQRLHEGTPGKRLLGLRVVRADGSRLSVARSFGRYWAEQLTGFTFLAGYVMAAFDDQKRALHDYISDTRVVRGDRERE